MSVSKIPTQGLRHPTRGLDTLALGLALAIHVHFMFFVSISFALGSQFLVEYGLNWEHLSNFFTNRIYYILRIDNGDLGAMWPQWCVFSDILVIFSSIWT